MRDSAAISGESCSLCGSSTMIFRKMHKMVAKMQKPTKPFTQQQEHEDTKTLKSTARAHTLRPCASKDPSTAVRARGNGPRIHQHKGSFFRKRLGLPNARCSVPSSCAAAPGAEVGKTQK